MQQLRGGELPSDIVALISQLREAEAALQALERDGVKAASSLHANKVELERSVKTGVESLTGPEGGDCMLVGGCCGEQSFVDARHLLTPTVASPPSNG